MALIRKNQDDPTDAKFNYNLTDPEVFPVQNCTEAILEKLREDGRGEAQEDQGADPDRVRDGDQHPLW